MNNFESRVKQISITVYENRLIQGKNILFKNATQKLCYLYLYSYANAHKIFPSMDSIAQAICASKRTAIETIKYLEEVKLIEVKRKQGLSNNYILNDYFETQDAYIDGLEKKLEELYSKITDGTITDEDYRELDVTLTWFEEVKILHQCKNFTSADSAPVQNFHQTSAEFSPVPVQNLHPKKTNAKTKNLKIKYSLPRLDDINSVDKLLKSIFPEVPFDDIKNKMIEDAKIGKVIIDTKNRYQGLLTTRIEDWSRSKKSGRPFTKYVEQTPEWVDEQKEQRLNTPKPEELTNEEKKRQLDEILKEFKK